MTRVKAKPSDFMGGSRMSGKTLRMPTLVVTKLAQGASKSKSKRMTAYNIDSLEKLIEAFDEREREVDIY